MDRVGSVSRRVWIIGCRFSGQSNITLWIDRPCTYELSGCTSIRMFVIVLIEIRNN